MARRILVATEGTRTEPQYVEGLNKYLRSKETTTVVKTFGVGRDPLKVVERCVQLRNDAADSEKAYDICVCLVDVDRHATLTDAIKLAQSENIILLISNSKFEVWLRWHVEDKRAALVSAQLDKIVENLGLISDKKLSLHFPFERVDSACIIARNVDPDLAPNRVGKNPSSAMPILVDLMREGRADT